MSYGLIGMPSVCGGLAEGGRADRRLRTRATRRDRPRALLQPHSTPGRTRAASGSIGPCARGRRAAAAGAPAASPAGASAAPDDADEPAAGAAAASAAAAAAAALPSDAARPPPVDAAAPAGGPRGGWLASRLSPLDLEILGIALPML
jgi:hypothetical protein